MMNSGSTASAGDANALLLTAGNSCGKRLACQIETHVLKQFADTAQRSALLEHSL
jgi:hypothetical protein